MQAGSGHPGSLEVGPVGCRGLLFGWRLLGAGMSGLLFGWHFLRAGMS
jgi:hypothetical protein